MPTGPFVPQLCPCGDRMSRNPLWRDGAEIIDSLATSNVHRAAEVVAYLERRFIDDERRAQIARRNAQRSSAMVEAGIRAAVVAVPAGSKPIEAWRGLTAHVLRRIVRLGPETFGLSNVPDRNVVSRVIRQMDEERRRSMNGDLDMGISTPHQSAVQSLLID